MVRDVVVLGATIAGLTAARRLAAEGFAVMVLDPNPEATSAAIGHGVGAVAHASTCANMAGAYGEEAAAEHVRRNLAGLEEIRKVLATAGITPGETRLNDHSLGVALVRELDRVRRIMAGAGAEVEIIDGPSGPGLGSSVLLLDPHEYATALHAQAHQAGARITHDVTVTHIRRLDGVTEITIRRNLAWVRDVEVVSAHAVVDTLGVSPWGALAGAGRAQYVPTLRLEAPSEEVRLHAGPPVWMRRPVAEGTLLLGPKCAPAQLVPAAAALATWAATEFGVEGDREGQLVIDPSDHGRPIVGASAIPGGFYTRGNGRGELMNGTASGCYLAALLLGVDVARNVGLPWASKLRAVATRTLFRRT
ncbi:FAD-binding oxidoreductase [Arachnia propionica]|uniref:FAD-binding oxidoreductase n=1 Tax=Arachnia propionica TaxID=1750 RepID=A0A3P1T7S1_9ACTN|nr:FAD-dependent oxidoreductase [Arachnia propionica]RRD05472.1 FAD-binding oxidoreductase [Arachnia propionica]